MDEFTRKLFEIYEKRSQCKPKVCAFTLVWRLVANSIDIKGVGAIIRGKYPHYEVVLY